MQTCIKIPFLAAFRLFEDKKVKNPSFTYQANKHLTVNILVPCAFACFSQTFTTMSEGLDEATNITIVSESLSRNTYTVRS